MTTRKNFNGSELQFIIVHAISFRFIIVLCNLFQIIIVNAISFRKYIFCNLLQDIYLFRVYLFAMHKNSQIHINESSMFWCNGQIAVMVIHI